MKKVNIALRDETHTQAKLISVIKDVNMSDYLQRAIEEAVEKDRKILDKIKDMKK